MWDIGLITDALVIIGTDENPSETQRESTGTARRSDFENVVPHGALPIKIRATSLSRVLRRGSALGLPPHLGFHPGARQQWSSHPRSTQAHHVVHSPRPRLPSRPAAPTCMAPCSVANNRYRKDTLHRCTCSFFFISHRLDLSLHQNSYLADSARHCTARSTRTTSLTPLISTHSPLALAVLPCSPRSRNGSIRDIQVSMVWYSGAAFSGSG